MIRTKQLFAKQCEESTVINRLSDSEKIALQRHLIKMYKDIEVVCEKNHLTMMLAYGSVLGAVRHNGFIPWDDDLDIYMPRYDYNLFVHKYAKDLPSQYILYAPNSNNKAISRFAKVMDSNTKYVQIGSENNGSCNGVFIDIFPLENCNPNRVMHMLKKAVSWLLMYIAGSVQQFQNHSKIWREIMCSEKKAKQNYYFRSILGCLFSFISTDKWFDLVDSFNQKTKETGYYVDPSGSIRSFVHPKDMFFPPQKHQFDSINAYIPKRADDYLSLHYGNWEELPKESDRWHHYYTEFSL